MKYIRFTQVDAKTKISINVEHSHEGPIWPEIKGLNVLFQDVISREFWYATVDDDATDNPDNQCWIISLEQFAEYTKWNIDRLIDTYKTNLYDEEKLVRNNILGKYHATASLAGIYKYDQALTLLADNNAPADVIRVEAATRGIDPFIMAEKIKIHHESFRNTEAKIAGIRGKLLDRLNSFQFDASDPWVSYQEFLKMEIVGQRTVPSSDPMVLEPTQVDVATAYYGTDIAIRLVYME